MDSTAKSELFLSVIQANKGIIYKVAHSYCADAEDRKDLVQEITVQLWKSFDRYSDAYQYSTWIYRIALNVAISFYRKENRRKPISEPLSDGILYFPDARITDELDENIGFLQQFISELKELDKALMLLYLEEKSQKEIAEIVGITESNVATKIGRIKQVLKQRFSTLKA
ncbi:RNA polymerase sigma factor [Larkinella rosea]|uniref:Sigma-70 family RNA polymerase sigma factor n=1 Tax=Larkinella rosea TaxID=2025312 RepID=A0A3P1BCK9_9BACT|nr:sigma-70 family RNA polymerase sigma factor [Larkinella rosea]RRA98764.1 sigma-70 family RNA polymerase sigma factor [Larkinella rosea]